MMSDCQHGHLNVCKDGIIQCRDCLKLKDKNGLFYKYCDHKNVSDIWELNPYLGNLWLFECDDCGQKARASEGPWETVW